MTHNDEASSFTVSPAPERALRQMLGDRQDITIATAESCTGGSVARRITTVSGSSAYFVGGIVSYANSVKEHLLGVPASVLANPGAVSEECARAMAEGARDRLGARLAVSTTGIAGPDGGTARKPVGLVYIAVAGDGPTVVEKHVFTGDRLAIMDAATNRALDLLLEVVRTSATHRPQTTVDRV